MLLKYERLFNFNQHSTEIGSPVLSQSQQSVSEAFMHWHFLFLLFLTSAWLIHFTLESYKPVGYFYGFSSSLIINQDVSVVSPAPTPRVLRDSCGGGSTDLWVMNFMELRSFFSAPEHSSDHWCSTPCSPHRSDHKAGVTHCVTELPSLCSPDPLSNSSASGTKRRSWRCCSHCSGGWVTAHLGTGGIKKHKQKASNEPTVQYRYWIIF